MNLGALVLPVGPWRQLGSLIRAAEDAGVSHLWTFDHLEWRLKPPGEWLSSMSVLAAASVVTEQVKLGTLVASDNFRLPEPFVAEAVSLEHISGGRFVAGLGAGARTRDSLDASIVRRSTDRGTRFETFVRAVKAGLESRSSEVDIAVAATGPRGMRTAAKYADMWITNGYSPSPGATRAQWDTGRISTQVGAFLDSCRSNRRRSDIPRRVLFWGNPIETRFGPSDLRTLEELASVGISDVIVPVACRDEVPSLGSIIKRCADL